MRVRLVDLAPEWVRAPSTGGRLGFSFLCPEHSGDHRIVIYFVLPPDGDDAITAGVHHNVLCHMGGTFHELSTDRGLRHGQALIFVQDGEVITA